MASPHASVPPSPAHDHSSGPPSLRVTADVLGRPADFTLHPEFADSEAPGLIPAVTVRVSLRYRIALRFTVVFHQRADSTWHPVGIRCTQDHWLSSVKAVQPHITPAAAAVLKEQLAALDGLLAIARERRAAYALAEVHRRRAATVEARRRTGEAEEEFARYGISEDRAAAVLEQIYGPS
ncbi:hypothetical protein ABZX77_17590 [Streptomyces sp. NPDC004237]|uniref:hypothetical protein n=1 Tax=Streptomyces sp. NPDC004237 TaxID=3154455 RepID=UPI0033AC4016